VPADRSQVLSIERDDHSNRSVERDVQTKRRRVQRMKVVPTATYRLQLVPGFGFDQAAGIVDYLAALGVSHLYLSPILQAAPGSTHGYDVVDHSRLSADLGGEAAFRRLVAAARAAGLGIVVDVVPNHMALPTPASLNAPLWSVLRYGPTSPYARWFDVDWTVPDRAMLMPLLGRRIGECLEAGEISLDLSGAEPVVRYFDHVLPVRPGTESLPLPELLDRQWYRLAYWRVAQEELNYRRFFDVDTLAAIRVELPEVFEESHLVLLGLVHEGAIDGLRIDHPDGLADPRGYLDRLEKATGGCWVVVEKILEGSERLPADWACAGTTGYDMLRQVGGLFVNPAGAEPLTEGYRAFTGDNRSFAEIVHQAKRFVVEDVLFAEVSRLVQLLADICHDDIALRDHTRRGLYESLVELLVAFPVYRAYVVAGEPPPPDSVAILGEAAAVARDRLPEERHATLELVRELALGERGRDARLDEFVVRFQQTTGPVMAKGVEDTAFYRWYRLAALNEVGGDPGHVGVLPGEFHAFCERLHRDWPFTMTTLSTHDTKRSEDVRARLGVLSEIPDEWARAVTAWRAAAAAYHSPTDGWPDPVTEHLLWQTLVGAWPIESDRLVAYMEKATREAKVHTSWTSPHEEYDRAVRVFAERTAADDAVRAGIAAFVERLAPHARAVTLGQKLVQLTMPGVPDVYQGAELEFLALVDPDNRRPVDYEARRALLAQVDAGEAPEGLAAEKLLVVCRALRLRRAHPEWFGAEASYQPLATTTPHAVGFSRAGHVCVVVSRLTAVLEQRGGWAAGDAVTLPGGSWRDELTGAVYDGGPAPLSRLLERLPVALLVGSRFG
jgi:(1->4)-alpha-D-glucan 1-alpha-D-glucosylmutase